jgi:3'-phosphoadenosine 5'-phosphosulfate sulfotransferase (PAPS reductase)/FAD synthetase
VTTTPPALRLLSLGAGVQSTTLLMLAAEGRLPKLDAAIFSDTQWEPAAVYTHLNRLEREIAQPAGIPIYRVSVGNIRDDALNPEHRFASMPLFIKNQDGGDGMTRRQCSSEYKIKPIKHQVRQLLGHPHPAPVPRGMYAEQWIGISKDEIGRAKDSDVQYTRNAFPLLDMPGGADGRLGWTRDDCRRYLIANGWETTPKSACIGCPFHGNRQWRDLRDNHPEEWADAVDFDQQIRSGNARGNANGKPLLGEAYLHSSRLPLAQAPIDRVTWHEWKTRQTDIFDQIADAQMEDGDPDGCSPWSCRSGPAAA